MASRATCSVIFVLLLTTCASSSSSRIGECTGAEQAFPVVPSECSSKEAYGQYSIDVGRTWLENAGVFGAPKGLVVVFGPGPSVESICFKRFKSSPSSRELRRAARAVARIPVPETLACLEGHRAESYLAPAM